MSLANFWLAAFRLPGGCLKEIEKLCSAFLWSGPDLNTKKAKISWEECCKPKLEGVLGIRSLKEANLVAGLKLIWRLTSNQESIWVSWIKAYLIRKVSFWSISDNTTNGSWMWRKVLKLREKAKDFHRVEIKSGRDTSFWHDHWSNKGRLKDILGDRGIIDLGVPATTTVAEVLGSTRRRRHITPILNDIEANIQMLRDQGETGQDKPLWKCKENKYRGKFSSKETWLLIRQENTEKPWSASVWYRHSTPNFSFLLWISVHNRLSTCDRMVVWNPNTDTTCTLCSNSTETHNHLFFECELTGWIWKELVKGLLSQHYTSQWDAILSLASGQILNNTTRFILRYVLQTSVHTLWRERNSRRHGNQSLDKKMILQSIDKAVRNKLTVIREEGSKDYTDAMQVWFGTRQQMPS